METIDVIVWFCLLAGLVRAIDTVQQKYYVTTPLSLTPDLLDRVNVLAVGKCDILPSLLKNTVSERDSR